MTISIDGLLKDCRQFHFAGDRLQLDAELLLAHCLQKPHSWLYAHSEASVSDEQYSQFRQLMNRRRRGEPLSFLCGSHFFHKIELRVDLRALIPRPESELIIELALKLAPPGTVWVADLGTGTGALALALASQHPNWRLLAVDRMPEALELAAENRRRCGLDNVSLLQSSWCDGLAQKTFDVIVANPPYIDEHDPCIAVPPLSYEPRSALAAGNGGMQHLYWLVDHAGSQLRENGVLILEHGAAQGGALRARMRKKFSQIATHCDLSGHERVTVGKYRQIS